MNLGGFIDGKIFKGRMRFGGPGAADREKWNKKWGAKCGKCGRERGDHTFANHNFQEGGK